MQFDYLIVGAGIAGAGLAYELVRTGSVCLIEAETRPGVHATGRSAALFAPSYGGPEIRALTRASLAFFEAPAAGFGDQPLLKPRPCLYIARADQLDSLEALGRELAASGGALQPITREEAFRLAPSLRPEYVAAAALDTEARDIDVDALHQGFLRGARSGGAHLVTDARLTRAERRDGRWRIEAGGEILEATVIVDAAGAWADRVALACGAAPLGLQPLRRTAVLVDPPAGADTSGWPAIIDVDEQFYIKPDAGKLLLSPADETPEPPGDAQPDELDVAIAVDRVQAALELEVRRVNHRWAGLRTFAPDRVPVVGYDPAVEGFFWLAGQGGYGIQTAPALARTAAALVRREPAPEDVLAEGLMAENLRPGRLSRG